MTARPSDPHVGLVVEGPGDRAAVPLLLRRHLQSSGEYGDILGKPVPFHGRGNATVDGGIEGYLATAAARPGCVGVLVVLDADDDCAATLGPELMGRAQGITGKPVVVALAERNYEAWLYSSAEELDLDLAFDPGESGARAIAQAVRPGKYVKPVWQPKLTAKVDVALARGRSASLDRALTRFDELRARLPS
jgi:hypothetical protein